MLAIFGDIHLTKRIWTKADILDDASTSLQQAVDICLENKYDAVFLGDQFDSNYPPVEMVQLWCNAVETLTSAGLNVYTIDGNHDPGQQRTEYQEERSWTKIHPKTIHIDNKIVDCNGITVAGYDFRAASTASTIVESIENSDADIYCMHQFPRQYKFIDVENAWDIDLDKLTKPKTIFCGHIHDNYEADLDGGGRLYVVGSTNPRSIAETAAKAYYVVDKAAGKLKVVKKKLESRIIKVFNFHTTDDFDKEFEALEEFCKPRKAMKYTAISKPIACIFYDALNSDLFQSIVGKTNDRVHIFWRPKFKHVALASSVVDRSAVTLSDVICKVVEETDMKMTMLKLCNDPDLSEEYLDEYATTIETEK